MTVNVKWLVLCLGIAGAGTFSEAGPRSDEAAQQGATPDSLQAEIEGLKVAKVAWREIVWKSCLLEGLKESREKKKPVLLWVFIDRPADDARC